MTPHEMSPEEFASHPYAVFHSSHLDPRDVQNKEFHQVVLNSDGEDVNESRRNEFGNAIHVGTEQAALENHLRSGSPDNLDYLTRKGAARFLVYSQQK